jgi:hypothetical protein
MCANALNKLQVVHNVKMGVVGNWEKKRVRNCRQYKEGGGQQGCDGREGRRNSKPKRSINIIPEMYTLEAL